MHSWMPKVLYDAKPWVLIGIGAVFATVALFGSVAAGLGITLLPRALTDQDHMWDRRRIALFDLPAGIGRRQAIE